MWDEVNFYYLFYISVDRKRKKRMIKAGKISETVETYQSLVSEITITIIILIVWYANDHSR